MLTLSKAFAKVDKGLADVSVVNNFLYNQGAVYFHESLVRTLALKSVTSAQNGLLALRQLDNRCWTPR